MLDGKLLKQTKKGPFLKFRRKLPLMSAGSQDPGGARIDDTVLWFCLALLALGRGRGPKGSALQSHSQLPTQRHRLGLWAPRRPLLPEAQGATWREGVAQPSGVRVTGADEGSR